MKNSRSFRLYTFHDGWSIDKCSAIPLLLGPVITRIKVFEELECWIDYSRKWFCCCSRGFCSMFAMFGKRFRFSNEALTLLSLCVNSRRAFECGFILRSIINGLLWCYITPRTKFSTKVYPSSTFFVTSESPS